MLAKGRPAAKARVPAATQPALVEHTPFAPLCEPPARALSSAAHRPSRGCPRSPLANGKRDPVQCRVCSPSRGCWTTRGAARLCGYTAIPSRSPRVSPGTMGSGGGKGDRMRQRGDIPGLRLSLGFVLAGCALSLAGCITIPERSHREAQLLRREGQSALDAGRYAEAEVFFARAIEIRSGFFGVTDDIGAALQDGIGAALAARQEYGAAEIHFRHALGWGFVPLRASPPGGPGSSSISARFCSIWTAPTRPPRWLTPN